MDARSVMTMEESSGVGACKLIRMLKEDEHPDLTKKEENELADEEKRELRFFNPVHLTAEDWDDDNFDVTVANISS